MYLPNSHRLLSESPRQTKDELLFFSSFLQLYHRKMVISFLIYQAFYLLAPSCPPRASTTSLYFLHIRLWNPFPHAFF